MLPEVGSSPRAGADNTPPEIFSAGFFVALNPYIINEMKTIMKHDDRTLMRAINDLYVYHTNNPGCLTQHDLNTLEALQANINWLMRESSLGVPDTPHHHWMFDSLRPTLQRLEHKCRDHRYQKEWRESLLRQVKYSPDQPRVPAGNADGGQWMDMGGQDSRAGDSGSGLRGEAALPARGVRAAAGSGAQSGAGPGERAPKPKPFKVERAAESLHRNLSKERWGEGNCVQNVANAVRSTGINLGRPEPRKKGGKPWARDYGGPLKDAGFDTVAENGSSGEYPPSNYRPQKGDVAVIQPIKGQNPAGHMAMYDGKQWVSDFKQERDIWPNRFYQQQGSSYKVYRHANVEVD